MDQSTLVHALEWLLTPSLGAVALALAVVLLAPVLLHAYLARQTAYVTLPAVVLAGPAGAGKTALAAFLERAPTAADHIIPLVPTHTSQVPNTVELAVSADRRSSCRDDLDAAGAVATKFLLVDTPGHGKLRGATIRWMATAGTKKKKKTKTKTSDAIIVPGPVKALVFVLDAAALDDDGLADTAAYLYDLLLALQQRQSSSSSSRVDPIPVLIAANKAELFTAQPPARVRQRLEAELGRVRARRSKGLLDSRVGGGDGGEAAAAADMALLAGGDDDDEDAQWLGAYGSTAFSLDELRESGTEVTVAGGSVAEGRVDAWWTWMGERV